MFGRNQNHLITHLLTSLSAPHLDELQMELVVKTTAVCPDLLHWYLPSVRHAMEPRSSDSWVKCVTMVKKVRCHVTFVFINVTVAIFLANMLFSLKAV